MGLGVPVPSQWLLGLGVIVVISTAGVLAFNKRQRDAVLHRLHFHRRRASGASTPPRSISPSKKVLLSSNGAPDFPNTLPPPRRSALIEISEKTPGIPMGAEPSEQTILRNQLPMTRSYFLENETPKYTPTGFSTAEIKALGDFPAYDVLSGVPLPKPYAGFDPARALPRPYRPFRWAYHQTMCMLTKNRH